MANVGLTESQKRVMLDASNFAEMVTCATGGQTKFELLALVQKLAAAQREALVALGKVM